MWENQYKMVERINEETKVVENVEDEVNKIKSLRLNTKK